VTQKQEELENIEIGAQNEIEKQAIFLYEQDPNKGKTFLTEYGKKNCAYVLQAWDDLRKLLVFKYNDGLDNVPVEGKKVGYPKEWLEKVGYEKGPISYTK
ncbi:MAG: hypothetical protein WCP39_05940, partial [Chlamydiota bacterium]